MECWLDAALLLVPASIGNWDEVSDRAKEEGEVVFKGLVQEREGGSEEPSSVLRVTEFNGLLGGDEEWGKEVRVEDEAFYECTRGRFSFGRASSKGDSQCVTVDAAELAVCSHDGLGHAGAEGRWGTVDPVFVLSHVLLQHDEDVRNGDTGEAVPELFRAVQGLP